MIPLRLQVSTLAMPDPLVVRLRSDDEPDAYSDEGRDAVLQSWEGGSPNMTREASLYPCVWPILIWLMAISSSSPSKPNSTPFDPRPLGPQHASGDRALRPAMCYVLAATEDPTL